MGILILSLRNCSQLSNGGAVRIELDRRGAVLGRSPTVDWTLPDPSNIISGRHCEIRFEAGQYIVVDISTNGTFINGSPLKGSHQLLNGDLLSIGQYEVMATLPEAASSAAFDVGRAPAWGGWDSHGSPIPGDVAPSDWARSKPQSAISGKGPLSGNITPPRPSTPQPVSFDWGPQSGPGSAAGAGGDEASSAQAGSPWFNAEASESLVPNPASNWSSPGSTDPSVKPADDIWGKLAASNTVDWARGGFGLPPPPPPPAQPLGMESPRPEFLASQPVRPSSAGFTPVSQEVRTNKAVSDIDVALALGIDPDELRQDGKTTLATMGQLLRSLVSGLVVMLEARARAKAQMGAQNTSFEFEGNNPLKFARTPEKALAQLLNSTERGFMPADRAVQDAFMDLQLHQVATLKAMQGALRATLDRFSPAAIKARGQRKGLLAHILPSAQEATLWRAYEKEFSGVAQSSDEAFMEVFAKEFRRAYLDEAAKRKQ